MPKATSYPVTIDVAGYVDFDWTWDNRQACIPGYSKTINEEASFELGKPRRSVAKIVGGVVAMPFAIGGEAKLKTTVGGFHTTNFCLPTPPEPEPPEPSCKTLKGTLAVGLSPEIENEGDDNLAPLGRGVLISIVRRGGGSQTNSCLADRPTLRAVKEDQGVFVETTPHPGGTLTVPLAAATRFWALKPGGRLLRTIKIGGGCDTITAQASRLSGYISRCTISGRIVVVIKRLK